MTATTALGTAPYRKKISLDLNTIVLRVILDSPALYSKKCIFN